MAELEPIEYNDPHDKPVREYLSATLDGQLGHAEARFRQLIADQEAARVHRNWIPLSSRFRGWTLGLAGAAVAASLAALWAGPVFRAMTPGDRGSIPGVTPPVHVTPVSNPIVVEQDVQSQTYDDGTIMADDHTPIRILRRRDVERTRWFDQGKLQSEQVVPQDHVIYVHVRTD